MTRAPSEDSARLGHPPSIRNPHEETLDPWLPIERNSQDSDQTGRMPRLICVFAVRTCHFVGFVMLRLYQNRHFQCLLSPVIVFVPMFPPFSDLCSLVPLNPKSLRGPIYTSVISWVKHIQLRARSCTGCDMITVRETLYTYMYNNAGMFSLYNFMLYAV